MSNPDTASSVEAASDPVLVAVTGDADDRYRGVRGWLLFFCISLTILNPLTTAGILVFGFSQTASLFGRFPGMLVLMAGDTLVSAGLMVLSIRAGVLLWQVKPGAVRAAKLFLFVGAAYALIAPFAPLLAGLPREANGAILESAITSAGRGILYYAIWLNYLRASRRVKATYPDSSAPA